MKGKPEGENMMHNLVVRALTAKKVDLSLNSRLCKVNVKKSRASHQVAYGRDLKHFSGM